MLNGGFLDDRQALNTPLGFGAVPPARGTPPQSLARAVAAPALYLMVHFRVNAGEIPRRLPEH